MVYHHQSAENRADYLIICGIYFKLMVKHDPGNVKHFVEIKVYQAAFKGKIKETTK